MRLALLMTLIATAHAAIQDGIIPSTALQQEASALRVSLKYNSEAQRYEVVANPSFRQTNFMLGPSQISIVVPKQVVDQSLNVISGTGRWTDYSNVYSPSSAPNHDFHGIHTLGRTIDLQPETPLLLFAFTLPGGYVDGVRLYVNGEDPNSRQPGMMGGDFTNTLPNHQGTEFFKSTFDRSLLTLATTRPNEPGAPVLVVSPNPIVGEAVSVTARQFAPGDRLRLRLLSVTGVELNKIEEDAARLVNYRLRIPSQLSGQAFLHAERLSDTAGQKIFCTKLIILN